MKSKKSNENNIKNYIVVIVMFLVTFLAVFGLRAWYRNYKEYQLTIPVISGKVQEISLDEFKNYIIEHDSFFLYIGVAEDKSCRNLEKDLPQLLTDRNIKNETVYLNLTDLTEREEQMREVLEQYNPSNYDLTYPAFLIIEDKEIIAVAKPSSSSLMIDDVEKLLDEYEIGA